MARPSTLHGLTACLSLHGHQKVSSPDSQKHRRPNPEPPTNPTPPTRSVVLLRTSCSVACRLDTDPTSCPSHHRAVILAQASATSPSSFTRGGPDVFGEYSRHLPWLRDAFRATNQHGGHCLRNPIPLTACVLAVPIPEYPDTPLSTTVLMPIHLSVISPQNYSYTSELTERIILAGFWDLLRGRS